MYIYCLSDALARLARSRIAQQHVGHHATSHQPPPPTFQQQPAGFSYFPHPGQPVRPETHSSFLTPNYCYTDDPSSDAGRVATAQTASSSRAAAGAFRIHWLPSSPPKGRVRCPPISFDSWSSPSLPIGGAVPSGNWPPPSGGGTHCSYAANHWPPVRFISPTIQPESCLCGSATTSHGSVSSLAFCHIMSRSLLCSGQQPPAQVHQQHRLVNRDPENPGIDQVEAALVLYKPCSECCHSLHIQPPPPQNVQHIYPKPGTPEAARKAPGIGGDLAAIIAAKAASRKPIPTSPTRKNSTDEQLHRSMTGGEPGMQQAR